MLSSLPGRFLVSHPWCGGGTGGPGRSLPCDTETPQCRSEYAHFLCRPWSRIGWALKRRSGSGKRTIPTIRFPYQSRFRCRPVMGMGAVARSIRFELPPETLFVPLCFTSTRPRRHGNAALASVQDTKAICARCNCVELRLQCSAES